MNGISSLFRSPAAARLEAQAGQVFFGDPTAFPDVTQVVALIQGGLKEKHVVAAARLAGHELPVMTETLADLDAALPSLHRMSGALARAHRGGIYVFADRDGSWQGASFYGTHPEEESHIVPASRHLLNHIEGRPEVERRQFLGQAGLTAAWASSHDRPAVVVDTGLKGSIGERLDGLAHRSFGKDVHITPKLVCSRNPNVEQIMDLTDQPVVILPRTRRWAPDKRAWDEAVAQGDSAYLLAILCETLPKFHQAHRATVYDGQTIKAVPGPTNQEKRSNIDEPIGLRTDGKYTGTSMDVCDIDPAAAAVILYRIVSSALKYAKNNKRERSRSVT